MSSDPADASLSKPEEKPATFYLDFDKKTSNFWDTGNYDLGRQLEFNASPTEKSSVKIKVKDASNPSPIVRGCLDTNWGSVEVEENVKKGISVGVNFEKAFREWNLKSRHATDEVQVTAECAKPDSRWATEVTGTYNPNIDDEHVLSSDFSFALRNSSNTLSVGARLETENRSENKSFQFEKLKKSYSFGFLFSPTAATQYSLIYKPDKKTNQLNYDFSLFKKVTDSISVAGRAEGKADLRMVSPPILHLGGSWSNNGTLVRGFLNSRKEYGASYQVKLNPNLTFTLGLATLLSDDALESNLGFKVCFS